MICAARESGAKRTEKGIAGESRCRKATGLNGASRTTAGLPKTENSPSSGPQGQEGGFFMREKKFGKLFLTWLLAATMVLTLLPVSMLAMDAPGEAEDGEVVLAPVAGVEEEEAAPVEAAPCCWPHPRQRTRRLLFPRISCFLIKLTA